MTDAEIEAAVTTAHAYGKRVMSHARSSECIAPARAALRGAMEGEDIGV
jgi:imidazolonepropionase-like amidohydrolase